MRTPQLSRRLLILLAASSVGACAVQSTEMIDPRADRSGYGMGLDARDFASAAQDSVQKMLNSGALDRPGGSPYIVVIARITNDTMQRIDTDELIKKIRVQILNSGKAVVTTAVGRGGPEDDMSMLVRELRQSREFSQSNAARQGEMVQPELSLSGKLIQQNNLVDRGQRVDYYFQLTLTNLHTGLAQWENETPISKLGSARMVAW